METPLEAADRKQVQVEWNAATGGLIIEIHLHCSEQVLGRTRRELKSGTLTVLPLNKARSLWYALAASERHVIPLPVLEGTLETVNITVGEKIKPLSLRTALLGPTVREGSVYLRGLLRSF